MRTSSKVWQQGIATGVFLMPALVLAQAELEIHPYAGFTVDGEPGKVYAIEYTLDTQQPEWRCLEFLQLPHTPYLWIDRSAPATGRRFYQAVEFEPSTNLVFIPPGTFRMGSPTNEIGRWKVEGPQTEVVISRGFWMGRFEVTQGEYQSIMGENPSYHNGVRDGVDYGTDLTRPVEWLDYGDAVRYCERLTREALTAERIPPNTAYRLPTEAEWEYACRALTSTRFNYGEDPEAVELTDHAWYFGNRSGKSGTQPVGLKPPNAWGLHDMHGNVFEWCQDYYGLYPGGRVVDPQGALSSAHRIFRGGGWDTTESSCRSAFRYFFYPDTVGIALGFRVVLAPVRS